MASGRPSSVKVTWSSFFFRSLIFGTLLLPCCHGSTAADIVGPYLGFYGITGRAIGNPDAAYFTKEVTGHCACRVLCVTQLSCEAYWIEPLSAGGFHCYLTHEGPFVNRPQAVEGAFYGYRKHDTAEFDIDGMLYTMTETTMGWDAAEQECSDMEGYQLGMYKTKEQRDIVLKWDATLSGSDCTHVYLTDTDGVEKWGDGSLYYSYESSDLFYILNNDASHDVFDIAKVSAHGLQDRSRSTECRNLCQSDPFNLMLP